MGGAMVRTVVVGAGPVGLFTAIAMARRGREVVLVDRDPGPSASTAIWRRRGVMQFDHAHTFRGPVVDALGAELPDALAAMLRIGARVVAGPDGAAIAMHCRRTVFERVLRAVAARQPGLAVVTGHVDAVRRESGRAAGVDIDGRHLDAGLVIDASGRTSRVMRALRGDSDGGPCGAAYVTRQYRLRDGVEPGPVNSPVGLSLSLSGYFAVAFRHDGGTFSITITHDGTDPRVRTLRHAAVYESVVGAIPLLAEWIDPWRAYPITPVLPGGQLYNSYCGQLDDAGRPRLPGLVAVGDAVCTTTPLAGRGVTLGLLQSRALIEFLTSCAGDDDLAVATFDGWCRRWIRPWFLDHVVCDADRLRRWAGGDVDLTRPLPSDLIVAAAQKDATLRGAVADYDSMSALPSSLDDLQVRARAVYASGWRPTLAEGPDREELAQLCVEASSGDTDRRARELCSG